MSSKEELNATRAISVAELVKISMIRTDKQTEANLMISNKIDKFINSLDRGDIYEKDYEVFTGFMNASVLFTAANERSNLALEEIGEEVLSTLQLDAIDPRYLKVLLREFQKKLLYAHHGHATTIEKMEQYAKLQILSDKRVFVPETIVPEAANFFKQLENGTKKSKKKWKEES